MTSLTRRVYRFNAAKLIDTLKYYLNLKVGPADNYLFIGDPEDTTLLTDDEVLKRLRRFLECNAILTSYGPAEILLENLDCFQRFANNFQILRTSDNLKYHSDTVPYYYQNQMFLPKSEIHQKIVEGLVQFAQPLPTVVLERLLAVSLANRYQKNVLGSFELVPMKFVEDAMQFMAKNHALKKSIDGKKRHRVEKSKANLTGFFELVADTYFVEKDDKDLVVELFKGLKQLDTRNSISENIKTYEKILERFDGICSFAKNLYNHAPLLVQPIEKVKRLPFELPMGLRFFSDGDANKFMFAKDVENALIYELRLRNEKSVKSGLVELETPKQRLLGIVKTMLVEDADKLFLEHGIDLKKSPNLTLIEEKIFRIQDEVTIPVCSPYSTHCKPALDVYAELFDDVCLSLQLFEKANPDTIDEIVTYFTGLNIFAGEEDDLYFVELAVAERAREHALENLTKLVTEPVHHIPTGSFYSYQEDEISQEIEKMARTITLDPKILRSAIFNFGKQNKVFEYLPGHLSRIFVKCARIQVTAMSIRLKRFVEMQNERDWIFDDEQKEQGENVAAENLEPATIEVHEVVGYQRVDFMHLATARLANVTADGRILMDQMCVYDKCLNYILDKKNIRNYELASLISDADKSKMYNLFICDETETDAICEKFYEKFLAVKWVVCTCGEKTKITDFESMWRKTTACDNGYGSDFWVKARKIAEHEWNRLCADDKSATPLDHFFDVVADFNRFKWARNPENFCEMAGEEFQQCCSIRLLKETRGEGEWHMFGEEVSMVLRGILKRAQKYSNEKIEQLEQWERTWFSPFGPAFVAVPSFQKIVAGLGIMNQRFLLISDTEMTHKLFELPLQTTNPALMILGTGKVYMYSQCQAQLYIFDQLINRNAMNCDSWYDIAIGMMKTVQMGYNLAEKVQKNVEQTKALNGFVEISTPPKKLKAEELEVFQKTHWNALLDKVFQHPRQNEELKSNLLKALKVVILDDLEGYLRSEFYTELWRPARNAEVIPLEKAFALSKDLQIINLRRRLLNIDSDLLYLKYDECFDTFKALFPIVESAISIVKFEPIAVIEKELFKFIGACFAAEDFKRFIRLMRDVKCIEATKMRLMNYLEFTVKDGKVVCRRFVSEQERDRKKEEIRKQLTEAMNKIAEGEKKSEDKKVVEAKTARSEKLEEMESAYHTTFLKHGMKIPRSRDDPLEKLKKTERLRNVLEERKARAEAEKNEEGCSASVSVSEPEPVEVVKLSKKARRRARKLEASESSGQKTVDILNSVFENWPTKFQPFVVDKDLFRTKKSGYYEQKEVKRSSESQEECQFEIIAEFLQESDKIMNSTVSQWLPDEDVFKMHRATSKDSGIEDRKSSETQNDIQVQKEQRSALKDSGKPQKEEHRRVSEDSGVIEMIESNRLKKYQKELAGFKQKCKDMEEKTKQLEYEKTNLQRDLKESRKASSSEIAKLQNDLKLSKNRVERLDQDIQSDRSRREIEVERTKKQFEIKISEMESRKNAEIEKVKKDAEKQRSRATKEMKDMAMENEKLKMRIREFERAAEKREEMEKARRIDEAKKLESEKMTNMRLQEKICEQVKDIEKEKKKLEEEEQKRLKIERRNHEISIERSSLVAENAELEKKIKYIQTQTEVNLTLFDINPSKQEPVNLWPIKPESSISSAIWDQASTSNVDESWKDKNENKKSDQVLVPNPLFALIRDLPPNYVQQPRNSANMHFRRRNPLTVYNQSM